MAALLLVCSAEMEYGERRDVAYRACFRSQLCPKGPFVQALSCGAGGCLPHDAKGNRDFFVVRGPTALPAEIEPKSAISILSLSKSGHHSAGALEHEFTSAAHVQCFGLVILLVKEKPFISPS